MNSKIRKVIRIAKEQGVKVTMKNLSCSGFYLPDDKSIHIKKSLSTNETISAIFHELGHNYCYENRIYPAYHNLKHDTNLTKKEKKALVLTAWKAEKYVDNWGQKEMKKHFPNINYIVAYRTKDDKKWLHENELSKFKK